MTVFGHSRTHHFFLLRSSWVDFTVCFGSLAICTVKCQPINFPAFSWIWADGIVLNTLRIHSSTSIRNYTINDHHWANSIGSHTCPCLVACPVHLDPWRLHLIVDFNSDMHTSPEYSWLGLMLWRDFTSSRKEFCDNSLWCLKWSWRSWSHRGHFNLEMYQIVDLATHIISAICLRGLLSFFFFLA